VLAHARQIRAVLGTGLGSSDLRRLQLAFAGFNSAEWGVWIAMLVYAYEQGGATEAGFVALIQLAPAAVFAPFAATLADRHDPGRVRARGYVAPARAMGATAAVLIAGAPAPAAYLCAALAASAVTITRPAQAVLVPSLVRSVDELTATNVVCGWIESISLLLAPIAAGLILAVSGPGTVFAVMAAVAVCSALLASSLHGAPAAAGAGESGEGSLAQAVSGFRMAASDPSARMLVCLLGTEFFIIGALDVMFVVLAIDVLDLGGSGAGYLNAAFGAGGVIGIVATVGLVGRARLAPALLAAAVLLSAALLGIGIGAGVALAFLLLATAGTARTVLDVAARTLLQRTAPSDVLARVFGLLETLDSVALAAGSLFASALVAGLGPARAMVGLAAVLPIVLVLFLRRLDRLDASADVPVVECALLRSVAIFESLGAPTIEGLARALKRMPLESGQRIIEEGQTGSSYFVIADGTLEVSRASGAIATVSRGDGVGEISLLRGLPCNATVTAVDAALVYAIDAEPFIEVVTGHAASGRVAERQVRERTVAPAG
jgi:MFS family permease